MILEKTISKEEIQKRVLKNGKPLDLDLFEWIPERNEFKSDVDGLVIDFSDIQYDDLSYNPCYFKCNDFPCISCDNILKKSFIISIKNNSIFKCYLPCSIKAGYGCQFHTHKYCIFHTDCHCQFKTSSHCGFYTKDYCQFDTCSNCYFYTGDNCEFHTGYYAEFSVGNYCIIQVDTISKYYTIHRKGHNCRITDDDLKYPPDESKEEKEKSKFNLDETTKECLKEFGIGFIILLSISLLFCFLCNCLSEPQPIITREIYIRMF